MGYKLTRDNADRDRGWGLAYKGRGWGFTDDWLSAANYVHSVYTEYMAIINKQPVTNIFG